MPFIRPLPVTFIVASSLIHACLVDYRQLYLFPFNRGVNQGRDSKIISSTAIQRAKLVFFSSQFLLLPDIVFVLNLQSPAVPHCCGAAAASGGSA